VGALKSRIKHAFAVDPPGPAEPTPEQQEPVDWFCRQVAKRRLATPGLVALEMSRPLNFLTAQAMHFFAPGVWALARPRTHDQYQHFAAYLERRGSFEYLGRRIEHFEAELERERKAAKEKAKAGAERTGGPPPDGTGPEDRGGP
jgi:hypothetical protein